MRHPAELFSNVSGDERFERVQVCCEKEKQEALTVGDTRHSLEIRINGCSQIAATQTELALFVCSGRAEA
jgi:hypothetical protein